MYLKLFSFICAALAVLYYYRGDKIDYISKFFDNPPAGTDKLFTAEELSTYDGIKSKSLYLSITGKIYDVTQGSRHYGPDSDYNIFIGRDASRSFITGEFSDTSKTLDDILDLSKPDMIGLDNWKQLYEKQYIYKGKLIGRFYDKYGFETDYLKEFQTKLNAAKEDKANEEERNKIYPTCNVEWNASSGTRVWCTNRSGGVSRDWEGVPRLMHTPGLSETHCVCINQNNLEHINNANLKEYDDCSPTSNTCYVKNA